MISKLGVSAVPWQGSRFACPNTIQSPSSLPPRKPYSIHNSPDGNQALKVAISSPQENSELTYLL